MKTTVFSVETVESWSCVTKKTVPKHTTSYALTWLSHHMESGSARGTSARSAAVRPSPSASSAHARFVEIMKRALWSPLLWKAGSAARSTTPSLLCRQNTGARSNANWNHKIMEKNWKNKWVVISSFFLFFIEMKKRKRNKWLDGTLVGESCRRADQVQCVQAEAIGHVCFSVLLGWGFFGGGPNSLGLLLPFIMLPSPCSGKKSCLRF